MSKIIIEQKKGQRREFNFLTWKDDRLAFLATKADGKGTVVMLTSAYPEHYESGRPFRFPMIAPLHIVPKRFKFEWSDHHRDVFKRWRESKLAEVDAQLHAEVEYQFSLLSEWDLPFLYDPVDKPLLLGDFLWGKWAPEMGKDFHLMMDEVYAFQERWQDVYDYRDYHHDVATMVRALLDVRYVMRMEDKLDYHLKEVRFRLPTDREVTAMALMQESWGGDTVLKQIDDTANRATAALTAVREDLAKVVQQARADFEAGASTLGARTQDLAEIVGKVPETFADPLLAAARDASIKRGVPDVFAWWVFQERHHGKFPTVDGAFKRCGLGPQLEKDGFGFSRPTVGRWLKIIYEELEERKLMPKRGPGRSSVKARDFDVAQAKDAGPLPGDVDEPPDDFVEWAQDKHAAGAMPSEEDVLDWLCARAPSSSLDSCSDAKLREIAKKWLKQAAKILGLDQTDPPEPEDDSDLRDDG